MRFVLLSLLLGSSVALADAPSADDVVEPAEECAHGKTTGLLRSARSPLLPRHDGPEGETRFEVRAHAMPIGALTLPGRGACRGFSPEAHAYIVTSVHERGVLLPIVLLELLAEDGKSRVTAFERGDYEAFALVTSASKRYVAFIGDDAHRTGIRLYVHDLVTDDIRALGPAPAPPPDHDAPFTRRWRWGVDGEEGATEIEPEVLRFDGDVLRASYGMDTSRARAKARRVRTFDVSR